MSLIKFQDYPSTETPLNAENLNHNFNELINIGGVLLWKNSNPSNDFTAQTLNLDLSNYDMVEIWCRHSKGDITSVNFKIIKGHSRLMQFADYDLSLASRLATVNESSITFEKCQYFKRSSGETLHQDSRMIPTYIIGYKTGLFN